MLNNFRLSLGIFALLVCVSAGWKNRNVSPAVQENTRLFRSASQNFASKVSNLKIAINRLEKDRPETVDRALTALKEARYAYKSIEAFMEYFFVNSARIYNRAAKNEIEEPFLEYQRPMGLQYIEAILFDNDVFSRKAELQEQLNVLEPSASDLKSLLYEFQATDGQILECHRLALIRVMTLGITGFDAPLLKTGIDESYAVLATMQKGISPYLNTNDPWSDRLNDHLGKSLAYLNAHPDFDTFDRLFFLTEFALPLQTALGKLISSMGLETNATGFLNYRADHLFSPDAFETNSFLPEVKAAQVALGEKLFNDPVLSGNGRLSCASCHVPSNTFQDGLDKSFGFDGQRKVARNAPTLLYASFQHSQFWDGRKRSLEEQIDAVIRDSTEMNADMDKVTNALQNKSIYRRLFRSAFPSGKGQKIVTNDRIGLAIASFVRTLHPFNSNFDRYIAGNEHALSTQQVKGFNLFMGKAQCGTCHFAPLFNGLIPPIYKFTEFEVLGTPIDENLLSPRADPDEGRISFRSIEFYKGAFKTPTVRNSAVTAPYMHNGGFASMDSVIEFYNKGGGVGIGLDVPHQTLSPIPLNLSSTEKQDIILFLQSLTDSRNMNSGQLRSTGR
jgi:cytochrome c peroxidase